MVIQRWQSVMLLIACVMMACFSFCSLGQIQTESFTFNFTSLGFSSEGQPTGGAQNVDINTWYFFAISIVSAIIPLIAIFCFRNLSLQRRLCLIGLLFVIATAATGLTLGYTTFPDSSIGWSTVIICPLLAAITEIWAYRLIGADDKKIRSVDHFRD